MSRWHDDEGYWREFQGALFPPARLEAGAAEVEQIVALLGLAPGASVLDMPCGPGRHSVELARRGFRVTGVDLTREYLDAARERAAAVGVSLALVHADMREYAATQPVDAVVNMWTSFGYFEDPADDVRTAANMFASLRPGGRLLMDLKGKEVLARTFRPRDWQQEADGTILLTETRVERDWTWVSGRWIVLKGERRMEQAISHRLYSAAELKGVLEGVGFVCRGVYGSLAGTPYDHEASRLVMVAERPEHS
jgi:SAM-dependent methyltransferase